MTAQQAVAFIHSYGWHSAPPGLDRMRRLLRLLGNPERDLHFIHVAGTNGKGSVCALVDSALRACGMRVGLFTSPYMVRFSERIRFSGRCIPNRDLIALCERVRDVLPDLKEPPSEFELIFAIACLYYKQVRAETVVLETGLGGRLDPTNVIEHPDLTVITGISLDHTGILGDTVEQIAAEKAGILKPGCPVVYGGLAGSAENVILETAQRVGVPMYRTSDLEVLHESFSLAGTEIILKDGGRYACPLIGNYQVSNLKTALLSLQILQSRGYALDDRRIRAGFRHAKWPGRFEILSKEPLVLIDGAHNPEGIRAAVRTVRTLFPGQKVCVLSGVMADKDVASIIPPLGEIAETVFTVRQDSPRALSDAEYASLCRKEGLDAQACGSVDTGLDKALEKAGSIGCPLVILGSLYLYAPVLKAIRERERKT